MHSNWPLRYEKESSIANNNNDCNRVGRDNEEGSRDARMHQADWQYQCAHRPIEALSHCPPPYHIAPPIPRAIRVGAATDAITRRQYAQAPHLMTPHSPSCGSACPPYWLLEMFRLGGFQPPNTDAPESPRVLPYILKVSKDILIIRISGNQFVSQTRHRRTLKISRPIFGPGPHKIIRPSGEHFGACTRPRDSN